MRELKIGDRVKYVADGDFVFLRGKTGTVKGFHYKEALVEFDEYINGHDGLGNCDAKTKDGHGYYVCKDNLFVIQPAPKFKVGDRVKIQGMTDHRAKYNGLVTTIAMINPNGKNTYKEHHYSITEKGSIYVFEESNLVPDANEKIVITTDGKTTVAKLYDGDTVVKEAKADCSPEDKFDFTQGAKLAFERLTDNFKFEVGKMYQHKNLIIEITGVAKRSINNYAYRIVKGDDSFSHKFDEGSCFARELTPYEPPKVYNGKVVCIKSPYDWWTVGKVYEVVNGKIRDNLNTIYPVREGDVYKDAEDVRHAGNFSYNEHNNPLNEFIPLVE